MSSGLVTSTTKQTTAKLFYLFFSTTVYCSCLFLFYHLLSTLLPSFISSVLTHSPLCCLSLFYPHLYFIKTRIKRIFNLASTHTCTGTHHDAVFMQHCIDSFPFRDVEGGGCGGVACQDQLSACYLAPWFGKNAFLFFFRYLHSCIDSVQWKGVVKTSMHTTERIKWGISLAH